MLFRPTPLAGAYEIEIELREDHRGFFARSWCQHEFEQHKLAAPPVQTNIALTKTRGTLRGIHYQVAPYAEAKLIRCTRGAIFDVIVDLRPDSPTFRRWYGTELSADNYRMLYLPAGFAHGYQSLADNTEVTYQVTEFYTPGAERGLRYDDAAFGIVWPLPVAVISEKDLAWPAWHQHQSVDRA